MVNFIEVELKKIFICDIDVRYLFHNIVFLPCVVTKETSQSKENNEKSLLKLFLLVLARRIQHLNIFLRVPNTPQTYDDPYYKLFSFPNGTVKCRRTASVLVSYEGKVANKKIKNIALSTTKKHYFPFNPDGILRQNAKEKMKLKKKWK